MHYAVYTGRYGKGDVKMNSAKEILNQELRRIVDRIIQEYSPEKIILFGSLAGGNVNEYSDIDLVIIKKTEEKFMQRLHQVRMLAQAQAAADFIVYTPEEVEQMKRENRAFLIKEILGKGEVLYERGREMV